MKYLILLFSLNLGAQTIAWDEASNATGYKLFYKIVPSCDFMWLQDFRYSYNVGNYLSYDIGKDDNFSSSQYYMFRVTAYNDKDESEQSETFACLKSNRPTMVQDVKKKFK